jgi:hypothetical protein
MNDEDATQIGLYGSSELCNKSSLFKLHEVAFESVLLFQRRHLSLLCGTRLVGSDSLLSSFYVLIECVIYVTLNNDSVTKTQY